MCYVYVAVYNPLPHVSFTLKYDNNWFHLKASGEIIPTWFFINIGLLASEKDEVFKSIYFYVFFETRLV